MLTRCLMIRTRLNRVARLLIFLVIDDLGKEAVNQSEKRTGSVVMARVFEELMRYRHARLLPTIITAKCHAGKVPRAVHHVPVVTAQGGCDFN